MAASLIPLKTITNQILKIIIISYKAIISSLNNLLILNPHRPYNQNKLLNQLSLKDNHPVHLWKDKLQLQPQPLLQLQPQPLLQLQLLSLLLPQLLPQLLLLLQFPFLLLLHIKVALVTQGLVLDLLRILE